MGSRFVEIVTGNFHVFGMSCVREASPPLQDTDHLRNDMKKKKLLQPFRAIGRILRRKPRSPVISSSNGSVDAVAATIRSSKENFDACEQPLDSNWEPTNKSHSTSHLTDDTTDNSQRRTLQSTLLSVSHDSVFTAEQRSPDSGSETSLYIHPTRLNFPHSSVRAELLEVIRKRNLENNVSDDEDLGLPRSPVSNSPTTADDIFTKEHIVTKSSQSTCSDGSLLSMGSSEIDEESYCHSSRHSSKLSLYEKRISTGSYSATSNNDRSSTNNSPSGNGTSLSHSAAKHKMAVKPKRNHGAPHKKRQIITNNTLPTTPEVNEENSHKILPPEDKQQKVAETGQSDEHESNQNYVYKTSQRESRTIVEYTNHHQHQHHSSNNNNTSVTQINTSTVTCSTTQQSKCASLPAGVSLSPAPSFKLITRSKSNAANSIQQSPDETVDESATEVSSKKEESGSFFSRLLLRRSSKKKKNAVDESDANQKSDIEMEWETTSTESATSSTTKEDSGPIPYANGINNAMKNHPLFRQRIEPLNLPDIPASPPPTAMESMPPTATSKIHTSTVPINMDESADTKSSISVKKSHSFRNHEKLPYSCYEDTPSLPVNIGLVEEETVTERFSKHYRTNRRSVDSYQSLSPTSSIPDCKNRASDASYQSLSPSHSRPDSSAELESSMIDVPEYETAGFRLDVKWKPTSTPVKPTPTPDYGNISVVNCNKVNISIEDGTKVEKTTDVKAPVPTPRTSLLSKFDTSDSSLSSYKEGASEKEPEVENYVNVTVTESSGQRSIVSISSSVETNSEPHSPSGDSVFEPLEFNETINNEIQQPTDQSIAVFDSEKDLDKKHTEEEEEIRAESPPKTLPSPKSKPKRDQPPPIIAEKPIIVTDFANGIVKVNDTTVVLRRKVNVSQARDDEPELMKVFARRSLKLKEPDGLDEVIDIVTKSRDSSDKENEDNNSSSEEQPRSANKKNEIKLDSTKTAFSKFQRSVSQDVQMSKSITVLTSNNNEKRQRCRSIPNEMDTTPPKSPPPIISTNVGEEIIVEKEKTEVKNETPYKRIQQRREEWEKRAQQARGSK
ncbi:uncharacterized protein DDB_G0284459 isoform X2 [Planococcus citri]|uniref:uncharacterized protein DDB_G0284459 isoform X2 n=1 Tax=Planococcus citri TaxID=170843 RepID=UPI0031F9DA02